MINGKESKKKIVRLYLEEGCSLKSLATEYGVSHTSNSDKISVVLANKYANDFDYRVCEKIVHEIEKNTKKRN